MPIHTSFDTFTADGTGTATTTPGAFKNLTLLYDFSGMSGGVNLPSVIVQLFMEDGSWVEPTDSAIVSHPSSGSIEIVQKNNQNGSLPIVDYTTLLIKGVRPRFSANGNTGTAKVQLTMED